MLVTCSRPEHTTISHQERQYTRLAEQQYGEMQTMSHIVDSCPPTTKFNSGLPQLHSADNDAISQLTS